MLLATIDWSSVFVPKVNLLEIILRGSIMYLGLAPSINAGLTDDEIVADIRGQVRVLLGT